MIKNNYWKICEKNHCNLSRLWFLRQWQDQCWQNLIKGILKALFSSQCVCGRECVSTYHSSHRITVVAYVVLWLFHPMVIKKHYWELLEPAQDYTFHWHHHIVSGEGCGLVDSVESMKRNKEALYIPWQCVELMIFSTRLLMKSKGVYFKWSDV